MFNNPFMNSPMNNSMTEYYRNQMQQAAQPGYSQPQFNPGYSQPRYTINHVTSIDEAKSQMVDPLVTSLYMDTNAGKIYLKRLNNQGQADFLTFALEEQKEPTQEENPLNQINQRLKAIEEKLGEKNYGKSTSNVSADDESRTDDAKSVVAKNATVESSADE